MNAEATHTVTAHSIRERILKVHVASASQLAQYSYSPLDPREDTESRIHDRHRPPVGTVTAHSIRERILKARLRRSDLLAGLSYSPLDPREDTESGTGWAGGRVYQRLQPTRSERGY